MATVKQIGLATLGGSLLGAKIWGLHKVSQFIKSRRPEEQPAWNNRRSFAHLPRRKQRELIYRKRAQLRDYEVLTYGGSYSPRSSRRRRRGFLFGS